MRWILNESEIKLMLDLNLKLNYFWLICDCEGFKCCENERSILLVADLVCGFYFMSPLFQWTNSDAEELEIH